MNSKWPISRYYFITTVYGCYPFSRYHADEELISIACKPLKLITLLPRILWFMDVDQSTLCKPPMEWQEDCYTLRFNWYPSASDLNIFEHVQTHSTLSWILNLLNPGWFKTQWLKSNSLFQINKYQTKLKVPDMIHNIIPPIFQIHSDFGTKSLIIFFCLSCWNLVWIFQILN